MVHVGAANVEGSFWRTSSDDVILRTLRIYKHQLRSWNWTFPPIGNDPRIERYLICMSLCMCKSIYICICTDIHRYAQSNSCIWWWIERQRVFNVRCRRACLVNFGFLPTCLVMCLIRLKHSLNLGVQPWNQHNLQHQKNKKKTRETRMAQESDLKNWNKIGTINIYICNIYMYIYIQYIYVYMYITWKVKV